MKHSDLCERAMKQRLPLFSMPNRFHKILADSICCNRRVCAHVFLISDASRLSLSIPESPHVCSVTTVWSRHCRSICQPTDSVAELQRLRDNELPAESNVLEISTWSTFQVCLLPGLVGTVERLCKLKATEPS
jgi:hypothetical protein